MVTLPKKAVVCRLSAVSYRGFTLIELLVTVSIIALLMTIAVNSFFELQKNSRDAKRKADLRVLQSSLEQYHADQGFYPASSLVSAGLSLKNPGETKNYMTAIPDDPDSDQDYDYKAYDSNDDECIDPELCTSTKYCLYALLENADIELNSCPENGSYNYAVTPP